MKYAEFKDAYFGRDYIIILGPQRSGTTFAGRVISADFGLEYVDEKTFGVHNYSKFISLLRGKNNYVVQAPALTHWAQDMYYRLKSPLIAYIERPLDEIKKSEKRIGWKEHESELAKFKALKSGRHPAEVKYAYLDQIGAIPIDYHSFENHPLWRESRRHFRPKQTK